MFARINFLLGLGILIVITFYFVGTYLVILPLSVVAPQWVGPAAGIAILAGTGLTVQLLSMAMSNWRGVALYENGELPGMLAMAGQAATIFGHIGTIYVAISLLVDGEPVTQARLLMVAALYLAGVALALHEWRRRKHARS